MPTHDEKRLSVERFSSWKGKYTLQPMIARPGLPGGKNYYRALACVNMGELPPAVQTAYAPFITERPVSTDMAINLKGKGHRR